MTLEMWNRAVKVRVSILLRMVFGGVSSCEAGLVKRKYFALASLLFQRRVSAALPPRHAGKGRPSPSDPGWCQFNGPHTKTYDSRGAAAWCLNLSENWISLCVNFHISGERFVGPSTLPARQKKSAASLLSYKMRPWESPGKPSKSVFSKFTLFYMEAWTATHPLTIRMP